VKAHFFVNYLTAQGDFMTAEDLFEILTRNIAIDDLPEDLKFIATFCGMDVALSLMKHASGMNFTIPKNALNDLKKSYIVKHYDGRRSRTLEICRTCDVTERYVRKVIKAHREKRKT
jgi:hypothetical protein